jgi:hypothetical protein
LNIKKEKLKHGDTESTEKNVEEKKRRRDWEIKRFRKDEMKRQKNTTKQ